MSLILAAVTAASLALLRYIGMGVKTRGKAQRQLILASGDGDLALVEVLVGQGVNPNTNAQTPGYVAGVTPLLAAAHGGREHVAQFLLSLPNINLEAGSEAGWTALLVASHYGHLSIVKMLLDRGANPNAATNKGNTPLMEAAAEGRQDVAQVLLSLPNIKLEARSERGGTALVFAASWGHLNLVKLLLDHGAEPAVVVNSGRTVLDLVAWHMIRWGRQGDWEKRDRIREVLRHLVVEVGCP